MMATTTLTDKDLKKAVEEKIGHKIAFCNKLINDDNKLEIWWC
jgi:hypothetical protein